MTTQQQQTQNAAKAICLAFEKAGGDLESITAFLDILDRGAESMRNSVQDPSIQDAVRNYWLVMADRCNHIVSNIEHELTIDMAD